MARGLRAMSHDHPPALVVGVAFDEAIRSTVDDEICLRQIRSNLFGRNLVLLLGAGLIVHTLWRTVDNYQSAARDQRFPHMFQDAPGSRELMIGVRDQYRVDAAGAKMRIVKISQLHADVVLALLHDPH